MGPTCYCGRANKTVGRVQRTSHYHGHHGGPPPPKWWPGQSKCPSIIPVSSGFCMNGTVDHVLKDASPAECCAACSDSTCIGWSYPTGLGDGDKGDCEIYKDPMTHSHGGNDACFTAYKEHHGSSHGGYISSSVLGGWWYSTPAAGECTGSATPGDGSGCTWRMLSAEKYANASCVDEKVDAAVEKFNAACFEACPGGVANATSECYLGCYGDALNGKVVNGKMKKMEVKDVTGPWVQAFTSDEPDAGGCPRVQPIDEGEGLASAVDA